MDLRHTNAPGRPAPSGQPTPTGAFPPGNPAAMLSKRWKIDRLPTGDARIRPSYLGPIRLIALGIFLYGAFGTDTNSNDGPRTIEDMLLIFLLLLVPVLIICTWTEEWKLRPGHAEQRKRFFLFWRSRSFDYGCFAVDTPEPPAFRWTSLVWIPLSIALVTFGRKLMSTAWPDGWKPPFLEHVPEGLISPLAGGLYICGVAAMFVPFIQWSSAHPSSTAKRKVLLLRSGLEEVPFMGSVITEGTKELNALAVWLAQQTGWAVENAPVDSPAATSPDGSAMGPGSAPAYAPEVPPALPKGWNTEMQPDGSLRLIPGFLRVQTNGMVAILLIGAAVVLSVALWEGGMIWAFMGPVALLLLVGTWSVSRAEAWYLGQGFFEARWRSFGVWKCRRYTRGTIIIRPMPNLSLSIRQFIYPIAGFAAFWGFGTAYPTFIQPMLPKAWQNDTTLISLMGGAFLILAVAYVFHGVMCRTAIIEANSRFYLRAERPGSTLDIVDLTANNRRTEGDSGWVPSVDELRALAAWMSIQTGWPVAEVD